ncbi:hypothetical protein E3N88_04425 [Mikania micrantha]|uniref:Uncharacterized protein n=1 Tax=Mikania micrantha TaxID=192012 RepID=A0A5N6PVQ3_9ASTR|nr:hypothetical protein E3N88_04425 [Mikania micrantha]
MGSKSLAKGEEEVAPESTPVFDSLNNGWDEFLSKHFHYSNTSSSSFEEVGASMETQQELTSNISMEPKIQQSPSGTKSPSGTSDKVTMEDSIQAETSISMEPVSPLGTVAEETLSSIPEFSEDTTKEPSKVVGQLEEVVNAKVNSEAVAASEGPVIFKVTSSEEQLADEPTGEATGSISFGLNKTEKGKRKLTPEEEAEQEDRRVPKKKG